MFGKPRTLSLSSNLRNRESQNGSQQCVARCSSAWDQHPTLGAGSRGDLVRKLREALEAAEHGTVRPATEAACEGITTVLPRNPTAVVNAVAHSISEPL